ncbi:MAG: hypothetical protein ACSHX6_10690 [Akkermansiaceae bacterium]
MIKRIITLTAVVAALTTTSCNTFVGVGQDVQKLGTSVQNTAIRTSQR